MFTPASQEAIGVACRHRRVHALATRSREIASFRRWWRVLSLDGQIRLNIFGFLRERNSLSLISEETQREVRTSAVLVYYRGEVRWTFSLGCINSIYTIFVCWKTSGYLLTFDLRSPGRSPIKYDWVELFQSWCFNNQVLSNNGDKKYFLGSQLKWPAKLREEAVTEIPIEQKKPIAPGPLRMVHLEGFENVTRSSKTGLKTKIAVKPNSCHSTIRSLSPQIVISDYHSVWHVFLAVMMQWWLE